MIICYLLVYFLFFFKQKTAYEMRISDWSSDVCSSDLVAFPLTSGFFSKDQILFQAWAYGHHEFYWMGLAGAFMTALYTFRLIFIAFFGAPHVDEHGHTHEEIGRAHV